MKRFLIIAFALLATTGCTLVDNIRHDDKAYAKPPFYAKYLNTGSDLDARITQTLDALRQNPNSPELHNTLGTLLVDKGFPRDAEREFERAIHVQRKYYPAWYNLGLVRAGEGDDLGARRAFDRTVDLKPGHAAALFQLGLIEEKRQHLDRAIDLYARAFAINPSLLEVEVNPRILDTKLTSLALLRMYPDEHARRSIQFQGSGPVREPQAQPAPSPEAPPQTIVPPAAPVTDPAMQTTPRPAPAKPPKK